MFLDISCLLETMLPVDPFDGEVSTHEGPCNVHQFYSFLRSWELGLLIHAMIQSVSMPSNAHLQRFDWSIRRQKWIFSNFWGSRGRHWWAFYVLVSLWAQDIFGEEYTEEQRCWLSPPTSHQWRQMNGALAFPYSSQQPAPWTCYRESKIVVQALLNQIIDLPPLLWLIIIYYWSNGSAIGGKFKDSVGAVWGYTVMDFNRERDWLCSLRYWCWWSVRMCCC